MVLKILFQGCASKAELKQKVEDSSMLPEGSTTNRKTEEEQICLSYGLFRASIEYTTFSWGIVIDCKCDNINIYIKYQIKLVHELIYFNHNTVFHVPFFTEQSSGGYKDKIK